ncbi:MAG: hypothetical protein LBL45_03885 [Treponema sp.]|jgi:hypothetical protein|nr:hypothetical protein [Treponema sp.]
MNKRTRNILIILGLALSLGFALISCEPAKVCIGKQTSPLLCETAVDEKGSLLENHYCTDFDCAARKLAINHEGKKAVRASCSCE